MTEKDATRDNGDSKEGQVETLNSVEGVDDVAAIPKGSLDPVYEAKARVLNHAV